MTKKYLLVPARKSHLKELYKLCTKAFKQGPDGHLEVMPEKIQGTVDALVLDDHQFAVVAMSEGRVKGVMLGHVDSHAYCKGLVASDVCLYVSPALRGTDCANKLVDAYVRWCGRIPNLVVSGLSLSQLNATTPYMESLFQKQGYRKAGIEYIKVRGHHE